MHLRRTTYTDTDRPIEFARGVHAASRFTWSYDFVIPD
jgi:GntR family transcriptional regulator